MKVYRDTIENGAAMAEDLKLVLFDGSESRENSIDFSQIIYDLQQKELISELNSDGSYSMTIKGRNFVEQTGHWFHKQPFKYQQWVIKNENRGKAFGIWIALFSLILSAIAVAVSFAFRN